jgi:hypothetical protein
MFTRFEEQWHCCGGARLGGAMQIFLMTLEFHSLLLRKNEE